MDTVLFLFGPHALTTPEPYNKDGRRQSYLSSKTALIVVILELNTTLLSVAPPFVELLLKALGRNANAFR